MGAEVIKVERPKEGDAGRHTPSLLDGPDGYQTSAYFLQQNMGKESLCVNLRDPRGLGLVHKLVDSADVFVENYRPGALDRLGLGYKTLSERNPRLVYCSVSAFGHTGPDAQRPGFGLIAEARSGTQSLLGTPGEAPPLFRMPIADMYAGIPAAPVQTIDKVMQDPQTQARGMVLEQTHPLLGKVRLPNLPFRFSDCDTTPSGPAPLLGQHNRKIAAGLGYGPKDIDNMVNDGVLYAEPGVAQI